MTLDASDLRTELRLYSAQTLADLWYIRPDIEKSAMGNSQRVRTDSQRFQVWYMHVGAIEAEN